MLSARRAANSAASSAARVALCSARARLAGMERPAVASVMASSTQGVTPGPVTPSTLAEASASSMCGRISS